MRVVALLLFSAVIATSPDARADSNKPTERALITSKKPPNGGINTANRPRGLGSNVASEDENVELAFDRHKGALYALYGRALRTNPRLAGKIVMQISIAQNGSVTECVIKSSELGDRDLEEKLRARIKQIHFGPRAAPVVVDKPIEFFPAS